MRALATTVHLQDADGKRHVFEPGQIPPPWAQERITNPKAWGEQVPAAAETPAGLLLARNDTGQNETALTAEQLQRLQASRMVPPRTGAGSSTEAWAAYAAVCEVTVPAGAGREEIIALLEEAGVPTTPEPQE